MSYCVNCGVRLAQSEPKCPLCGVEVINPASPWQKPATRPYPEYLETVVHFVDKRYFSILAAVLMLIPAAVCLAVDLLTSGGILWSGYVIGAILTLIVIVLLPLWHGKRWWQAYLLADAAAVLGYLFYINLQTGGREWFLPLAMPLTLAVWLSAALQTFSFGRRRKKGILVTLAALLFGCGALSLAVETIISIYRGLSFLPRWSWYAVSPCVLSGIAFLVLNRRNQWKESVKKRLFF